MLAVNTQPNIYWHGVVVSISTGVNEDGVRWGYIRAYGVTQNPGPNEGQIKTRKYIMNILCSSGLADYVESELDAGDPIFVVGRLFTRPRKVRQVYSYEIGCQADYIYKEDCLKFYERRKD